MGFKERERKVGFDGLLQEGGYHLLIMQDLSGGRRAGRSGLVEATMGISGFVVRSLL